MEKHHIVKEVLNGIAPELLTISKIAMTSTTFPSPITAKFLAEQSKDPLRCQALSNIG